MDSYCRSIDKLRAKFDANEPLNLREAAWVCWAELYSCWTPIYLFANWTKQSGVKLEQKFTWPIWKNLFQQFMVDEYPKVQDNLELIVKLKNMDVEKVFGKLNGREKKAKN